MTLDYAWLGQGLAVDLTNTYVPAQDADLLERWPQLTDWGMSTEAVRPLRSLATETLDLLIAGADMPKRLREHINQASISDPEFVTVDESGRRRDTSGLAGALARDLIRLIADAVSLKRCLAPGCGMVYIQTRAAQTWCSTSCGNRARVSRHTAKSVG